MTDATPTRTQDKAVKMLAMNGTRHLAWVIGFLLAGIFVADLVTPEYLHVGILYNICIALTLWSWRPRWTILVTGLCAVLRLAAHGLEVNAVRELPAGGDFFNLTVGILVLTMTGALIWRQMYVQQQVNAQAEALERALADTQQAVRDADDATERERAARRRERHAYQALERVKDLSAALSRAVLPDVPAQVAQGRLHLCARYAPAERDIQIGGDFYDLLALDEDGMRFGLVIGDVAGHGVEAAAQTALVTTTLRACAFESSDGPAAVLSRTARMLEGQLESFVSLFYGVYNAMSGTLTYACAGHEPPILISAEGQTCALKPTGSILGVGLSHFTEKRLGLEAGDTLIFLTDGLTELRRASGEMLNWEGIAEIAARRARCTVDVEQIADGLLEDVRVWAGRQQFNDDVALLIARVA